ncbi:3-hydroxy-9,10-secoandrosta-1,3,5(10)-triene-9,17-dione monooxygenase oxygenase subunit [Nocardioides sp. YIM 152315]|uniref:3-hydroxy-9,10-secoandrosta-1,3,5(10)-triene-9, 17-dione monooxygenase oxygenase subunit n=1 Tax=Nocardioides sp. YIM 152315 TaxID=3031760 RepID=UPI0023D9D7DF|nr:3-hydroxy-9,10-secoandrosta-1,3,5(10)-triene-9,17-dione monooxygenase oxygenase subunit [Nocardioides sp. YIM 152315]MDF1604673.1 acyl-CoA dehydrogenase family protein [Nocardioides sp. YIM 152315]
MPRARAVEPEAQPGHVLERVRALLPGFVARADAVDEARVLPEQTIAEIRDAGVFRMLQPARWGGLEADPVEFLRVVRAIAGACGSTGWVASIVGVHPWQLSLFPAAAQEEVWAGNADALMSSAYAPVGRLVDVDGGFRLSGRWSFSSGCDHVDWVLIGAMRSGEDGRPVDFVTCLVPRRDLEVVDVWNPVGLRGTGSNDLVVRDVFVPTHRVLRNFEHRLLSGPGQAINPGPLYKLPFGAIFTSAVAMPVIGAVAGCYDAYVTTMRDRTRLSLGGGRFVEDQFAQVSVARAATEIDAAVLQVERNLSELYAHAVAGREIPTELRLRARRDQVRGTERALEAVDMLFKTAGGTSLTRGNPIERAWRDAHAGSVHVANDVERTLALYGKGEFGLTVEDTLV